MDYEYQSNLKAYSFLVKEMDITYGGSIFIKERIPKGRKRLKQILKHMIEPKSTCENIAKFEWEQNLSTKVKLKSITDDIRKFINEKLIPKRIVYENGIKKIKNKNVKTYSLTPFGILYFIHLFAHSKNIDIDIERLANNYKDKLPFVFGRFEIFKEVFGEKYLDKIGIKDIADGNILYQHSFTDVDGMLNNFIPFSNGAWYGGIGGIVLTHNTWDQQLSYAIYSNILSQLIVKHMRKHTYSMQSDWVKLIELNSDIDKWFKKFTIEALAANKKVVKNLKILNDFLKLKEYDLKKTY